MVEISLSGSGEGPGRVTAPGYSTALPRRAPEDALRRRKLTELPEARRRMSPGVGARNNADLLASK